MVLEKLAIADGVEFVIRSTCVIDLNSNVIRSIAMVCNRQRLKMRLRRYAGSSPGGECDIDVNRRAGRSIRKQSRVTGKSFEHRSIHVIESDGRAAVAAHVN